jgi:hypothetical protein
MSVGVGMKLRLLLRLLIIVGLIIWAVIMLVRRQAGYRVTGAERYDAHYDDRKGGLYCEMNNKGMICDLPEVHYTFVHRGVMLFTQCQAWDKKNKCGELRVGETYQCQRDGSGRTYTDPLSCGEALVDIQRESITQNQHEQPPGPNEPPAPNEQPERPATLEEQGQCARQAREEFKLEGWTMDAFTSFTDHYSPKLGRCFMEVTSAIRTGNIPSRQKTVEDAFEGKVFAQYEWSNPQGKKYWEVAPSLCIVDGTVCKTTDEFDSLVQQRYGTGDSP